MEDKIKVLDELEAKVVELYKELSSPSEIYEIIKEDLHTHYSKDKKYCTHFIHSAIKNFKKSLSAEQLKELNERKAVAQLIKKTKREQASAAKIAQEKEKEEIIRKRIVELYLDGYLIKGIKKQLDKEIKEYFQGAENMAYNLVEKVCEDTKKVLTTEQYALILKKRQEVKAKEQKQIRRSLAQKVKNKLINMPGVDKREKLRNAINSVARSECVAYDLVRRSFKEFEYELYDSYQNFNKLIPEEEMISIVESSVRRSFPASVTREIPGYKTAESYVKDNVPELYQKVKQKNENNRNPRN